MRNVLLQGFDDRFANSQVFFGGKNVASGNKEFVEQVVKWVFNEKRVVSLKGVYHHREADKQQRGIYRIEDKMVYKVKFSEFYQGKWHPFSAQDIQLEVTMLDPHIRKTLSASKQQEDPTATGYLAFFTLPDVYGVFKFKLDYKRHGFSWLETEDIVEIRPFRHNEYPRFLIAAYPYYMNAFSMIAGFVFVSVLWLFHSDQQSTQDKIKKQ